tara:strand:- start:1520 stop:2206 length:687 start_codon:yes stop_codon:yes gene_type:complete
LARLGIITGSHLEAKCLRQADFSSELDIRCSGASSDRAGEVARTSIAAGCEGLVSFGLAGGLDPSLEAGSLIVADTVIGPDGTKVQTDKYWREYIGEVFEENEVSFKTGAILGLNEIAYSAETKKDLFQGTKAMCVDMESHAVIREASIKNIPFLGLRVVADTANDEVPHAAAYALLPDGAVNYGSLLMALAKKPSDISGLMRMRRLSGAGFETLRRIAPLLSFRSAL